MHTRNGHDSCWFCLLVLHDWPLYPLENPLDVLGVVLDARELEYVREKDQEHRNQAKELTLRKIFSNLSKMSADGWEDDDDLLDLGDDDDEDNLTGDLTSNQGTRTGGDAAPVKTSIVAPDNSDAFQDGWGDDDDIDIDLTDDVEADQSGPSQKILSPSPILPPKEPSDVQVQVRDTPTSAAATTTAHEILPEGWDDDDQLDLDDEDEDDDEQCITEPSSNINRVSLVQSTVPASAVSPPVQASADGWGDDDLQFDDSERNTAPSTSSATNIQTTVLGHQEKQASRNTESTPHPSKETGPESKVPKQPASSAPCNDSGWGDDSFLDFDDMDNDDEDIEDTVPLSGSKSLGATEVKSITKTPTAQKSNSLSSGGWGDDDFAFDESEDGTGTSSHPVETVAMEPPSSLDPRSLKLRQDLEAYLIQLPMLQSSMNALLQAEYNTPEKASELVAYYMDRPALTEYTIEKELARLEYSMLLPCQQVGSQTPQLVQDKNEIAKHIIASQQFSLLGRCANQSLLADILQVITGPDRLIRPQFMATAVADACRFRLDMQQDIVLAQAQLGLTIPTEQGRWKVGELMVQIIFRPNPQQPFVEYRIQDIDSSFLGDRSSYSSQLASAVDLLSSLHPDEDQVNDGPVGQDFRDAFLQQSQNMLLNSAEGMHSAWKEFEAVTGLRNKFNQLPGFLPADVVQAAEEANPLSPPQQRPTSILGGLVRTGFSQLAKKVALPDEDPTVYQDWEEQQRPSAQAAPRLYHTTTPPNLKPKKVPEGGHQLLSHIRPPTIHETSGDPVALRPIPPTLTDTGMIPTQHVSTAPPDTKVCDRPAAAPQAQPHKPQPFSALDRLSDLSVPQTESSLDPAKSRQHTTPQTQKPQPFSALDRLTDLPASQSQTHQSRNQRFLPDRSSPRMQSVSNVTDCVSPNVVQDGWEEDIEDFESDNDKEEATDINSKKEVKDLSPLSARKQSVGVSSQLLIESQRLPSDFLYDPKTGIAPTRTRWVNPIPGSRDLRALASR